MVARSPSRTRDVFPRPPAGNGAAVAPASLPEPEPLDERGMRRQTLYLPPGVYEHIRDTCYVKRVSQQAFFREVFDFYFAQHGMKTWAELAKEQPARPKADGKP